MPSFFARQEPFHEDGVDARRRQRRRRIVSFLAFAMSIGAVLGAAAMWAVEVGVVRALALTWH